MLNLKLLKIGVHLKSFLEGGLLRKASAYRSNTSRGNPAIRAVSRRLRGR